MDQVGSFDLPSNLGLVVSLLYSLGMIPRTVTMMYYLIDRLRENNDDGDLVKKFISSQNKCFSG